MDAKEFDANINVNLDATRHATIVAIAVEPGYSVATASRALNDFSTVKKKTKDDILKVAKRLKYVPNIVAQNLDKM